MPASDRLAGPQDVILTNVKHVSNSFATSKAKRNVISKGEIGLKVSCEVQERFVVRTPRVTRPSVCE